MTDIDFLALVTLCLYIKEGKRMTEKRRAKRMELNVSIKLGTLSGDEEKKYYDVELINLSKSGIAFKSGQTLEVGKCYDTRITIWTKEVIETVVRIARRNNEEYGGEFVGLASADEMKINIYELFNYPDEE